MLTPGALPLELVLYIASAMLSCGDLTPITTSLLSYVNQLANTVVIIEQQ